MLKLPLLQQLRPKFSLTVRGLVLPAVIVLVAVGVFAAVVLR